MSTRWKIVSSVMAVMFTYIEGKKTFHPPFTKTSYYYVSKTLSFAKSVQASRHIFFISASE